MPRRKLQNKLETSISSEKYSNTIYTKEQNNIEHSTIENSNTIDHSNTIENSNTIETNNTIYHSNTIETSNTIENINIKQNIIEKNDIVPKLKSLDTYFFSNKSSVPLSTTSTLSTSNKIHNNIISSSDSDDDDSELLSIDTILSLIEIKNRIDNLYENEFVEIFKIIKSNNEKFTTNNNGIFINICSLKPISINEITKFLIFSENNNKLIKKEEKERKIYREYVS